ncbi:MAG: hypothetical protein OXG70_04665 [Cyanobacteria bacterium MAG IRC1_bin_28]|nr:hypothetical protein [Cyanobacteria bacterium MAG IRC1_bin_28]
MITRSTAGHALTLPNSRSGEEAARLGVELGPGPSGGGVLGDQESMEGSAM